MKAITQIQKQSPELPTVTLTWHASKYKVHNSTCKSLCGATHKCHFLYSIQSDRVPLTAVVLCNSDHQGGAEERADRWSSVCPTVYMSLPAQREDRCSECVSLQTPSGPQAGEKCSRQAERISRRLEPSLIRPSVRANRQQHPPTTKHNQPTQNLHPSLNATNTPKICIHH